MRIQKRNCLIPPKSSMQKRKIEEIKKNILLNNLLNSKLQHKKIDLSMIVKNSRKASNSGLFSHSRSIANDDIHKHQPQEKPYHYKKRRYIAEKIKEVFKKKIGGNFSRKSSIQNKPTEKPASRQKIDHEPKTQSSSKLAIFQRKASEPLRQNNNNIGSKKQSIESRKNSLERTEKANGNSIGHKLIVGNSAEHSTANTGSFVKFNDLISQERDNLIHYNKLCKHI